MHTTAIEHHITTYTDSSLNAKLYRLLDKHKTEVNQQIHEMLDDKII